MVSELEWPIEVIPSADSVFMRAHKMHIREGNLTPGVFKNQGSGMSVDWDKYSSPEETRLRGKIPQHNAVILMQVAAVRAITGLAVEHSPDPQTRNRAHALVLGLSDRAEDNIEMRAQLLKTASVVLHAASQ